MKSMKGAVIAIISWVMPVAIFAQSQIELDEVEVSSNRSKMKFSKTAKTVSVISREEIERSAANSVNELLEYLINMDVRQRGTYGVQADLSIRGSNFSQVLVLVNGIKMNDPQSNHHNMNLPVAMVDIERIEILHGGASRIYGPGAFAGAINIITKEPKKSEMSLNAEAGENDWMEYGVKANIKSKKSNHSISYLRRSTDGYIRNTDLDYSNVMLSSSYHLKNTNVNFILGQNNKEFGAQNFYSSNYPDQFEKTNTQFSSLNLKYQFKKIAVNSNVYYRKHFDRYELFREGEGFYGRTPAGSFANTSGDTVSWYTGHNYHETHVGGAEVNISIPSKFGKTSVGYDYRHEFILSNILGEHLDNPRSVKGEHPSAYYYRSEFRDNHSVYFEHNLNWKKLFVSVGSMYNFNTDFDAEFAPGIDVAYQLSQSFRPYASVNRSFRFPTYTDLYYNLGGAVGSINLKPEESVNYEMGLKYLTPKLQAHLAFFMREGNNLIDWIQYYNSDTTRAANITEVNLGGAEVSGVYHFKSQKEKALSLQQIRLNYTYLVADTLSSGFQSNYVLDFLKHQANLSFFLGIGSNLNLSLMTAYQQRMGEFVNANDEKLAYEPVFLCSIKLGYSIDNLGIYLKVNNLFDQSYQDIGGVVLPGRWFRAGLSYSLPLKN